MIYYAFNAGNLRRAEYEFERAKRLGLEACQGDEWVVVGPFKGIAEACMEFPLIVKLTTMSGESLEEAAQKVGIEV